ncbi:hypothetical protein PoB_003579800 [Plakobranchus ocellatus]|uniref:Uncharacterized protein n=1 Tax=Plakobranchus ocellatus TaxID=259542 RepID=A0AAV4APK1_9GAST|nr:hypothetical protein PoB_003579800 [Plakobranchus ocellatus]
MASDPAMVSAETPPSRLFGRLIAQNLAYNDIHVNTIMTGGRSLYCCQRLSHYWTRTLPDDWRADSEPLLRIPGLSKQTRLVKEAGTLGGEVVGGLGRLAS